MLHNLQAISPIDGRYHDITLELSHYSSEFALIKYRLFVEIEWLIFLSEQEAISELPILSIEQKKNLRNIVLRYSLSDAKKIKSIEKKTKHDVKAIEYFLKKKLDDQSDLSKHLEFIHFACTSEDINNIAYALMLKEIRLNVLSPLLKKILDDLSTMTYKNADMSMLARTHGQAATPTTLGKEFANFKARLERQLSQFNTISVLAKINGATGNFNAHIVAYPHLDWISLSQKFIETMGLTHNLFTTQIEPHDYIAEYSHAIIRINTILIDFARDIWGYISLDYFKQIKSQGQIGSSTMPHKINPIDFENAEGNLGVANALFHFFSEKLPISRWQRDLSDSTVLRNLGVAIAHSMIAYHSLKKGLGKLIVNKEKIKNDLEQHWEVLAEAIQTILRKNGNKNAYELLLKFSQGKMITKENFQTLIENLNIDISIKEKLMGLNPHEYIGLASKLAKLR